MRHPPGQQWRPTTAARRVRLNLPASERFWGTQLPTKPSIFVLDDEPLIAESLALILIQHGYDAQYFLDPVKALEAMRAQAPHALLADVCMPGMNGIDVAIQMVSESIPTKIMLLSGQSLTVDYLAEAARQGHSFEVLPKPIAPRELLQRLEVLLAV